MRRNRPVGTPTLIVDKEGYPVLFFGNDSWNSGVASGLVDMSTRDGDLESSQFGVGSNTGDNRVPEHFFIIPEIDTSKELTEIGEIKVQLVNQSGTEFFIITASQLKSYAGRTVPYRIKKVYKTGTSEQFSIIW